MTAARRQVKRRPHDGGLATPRGALEQELWNQPRETAFPPAGNSPGGDARRAQPPVGVGTGAVAMLVWDDQVRIECPREKLGRLCEALEALAGMAPGIERHGALVAALIEAGELAQGLADALFAETGRDDRSKSDAAAMALLARLAAAVRQSWDSGFTRLPWPPEAEVRALAALVLPAQVHTKRAEGFALYSL